MVFPQLVTGASALYPVIHKRRTRTVVNTLLDGSTVIYSDPDAGSTEWELRSSGLTQDEWEAIASLFESTSGRLKAFTFLDPAGNLLAHSEDFSEPIWSNGPGIGLTSGVTDPFGTSRATHVLNSGGTAQSVAQVLPVPGDYQYSLSVWARSVGGASLTLTASAGAGSAAKTVVPGSSWQRYSLSVGMAAVATSATFGAQLPAGEGMDLFGMQVEAQPGTSDYKITGPQGGVYERARFAWDDLTVRAQGTDQYDAVIRIVTVGD